MRGHPDISHISTLNTNIESHIRILFDSFRLIKLLVPFIVLISLTSRNKMEAITTAVHMFTDSTTIYQARR